MKVDTMRTVDRFVGIPLCHAAGIVRRFLPQARSSPPQEWRSVLIIKFFGLGSVLLSSSFVAALHQRLPHIRIIYLTFGANRDILERMPLLSRRLTVSTSSIRHFLRDSLNALRVIRHEPVDAVFDLEFFSKFSTLMSSLSGAPVRVGYALPTRWRTMNVTVPVPFRHNRHVSEVFVSQLEAVGLAASVPPVPVSIKPLPSDVMSMERTLDLRTNGFAIVTININAGPTSLERRWPPHRFIEVCRDLLKGQRSVRFIFTGSAEERTYVEEALLHDDDVRRTSINAAGMLSLGELIALLQRSSLILTNDSGPMHVAAALGRPVVALFGPESPAFYGPPAGTTRTIYKAVSCSPCLNVYNAKLFVCPYHARCMKEISTTDVLDAIRSLRPVLTT